MLPGVGRPKHDPQDVDRDVATSILGDPEVLKRAMAPHRTPTDSDLGDIDIMMSRSMGPVWMLHPDGRLRARSRANLTMFPSAAFLTAKQAEWRTQLVKLMGLVTGRESRFPCRECSVFCRSARRCYTHHRPRLSKMTPDKELLKAPIGQTAIKNAQVKALTQIRYETPKE